MPETTSEYQASQPAVARRVAVTTAAVVREAALVVGLFAMYKVGRQFTNDHLSRAFDNARDVVHIERTIGWFTEVDLQRFFLQSPDLVRLLNRYYILLHFPVTVVFLVWAFGWHRGAYRQIRNVLAAVTFAGLIIHIAYPLAPPRMLSGFGFVDTGRVFGPGAYGRGGVFDRTANQIAAMPSLHFGWSVIVAWGTMALAGVTWRVLAVVHSVLTLLAIVVTANHYFLDAAVALLLVVLAVGIFGRSIRLPLPLELERPTLQPVRWRPPAVATRVRSLAE